ncbi:hypothetical protein BLOT_014447 [Blomia tropicalis]|nr:hypothetical protein BLOT_014447 [Blomia tropicalis]
MMNPIPILRWTTVHPTLPERVQSMDDDHVQLPHRSFSPLVNRIQSLVHLMHDQLQHVLLLMQNR